MQSLAQKYVKVRLECDVPRLEVVLAQSRLLLAARIARNAPDSLRALLQVEAGQDGSWVVHFGVASEDQILLLL